jgi:hypothetical protein
MHDLKNSAIFWTLQLWVLLPSSGFHDVEGFVLILLSDQWWRFRLERKTRPQPVSGHIPVDVRTGVCRCDPGCYVDQQSTATLQTRMQSLLCSRDRFSVIVLQGAQSLSRHCTEPASYVLAVFRLQPVLRAYIPYLLLLLFGCLLPRFVCMCPVEGFSVHI